MAKSPPSSLFFPPRYYATHRLFLSHLPREHIYPLLRYALITSRTQPRSFTTVLTTIIFFDTWSEPAHQVDEFPSARVGESVEAWISIGIAFVRNHQNFKPKKSTFVIVLAVPNLSRFRTDRTLRYDRNSTQTPAFDLLRKTYFIDPITFLSTAVYGAQLYAIFLLQSGTRVEAVSLPTCVLPDILAASTE